MNEKEKNNKKVNIISDDSDQNNKSSIIVITLILFIPLNILYISNRIPVMIPAIKLYITILTCIFISNGISITYLKSLFNKLSPFFLLTFPL